METKNFPLPVILSMTTGRMLCKYDDMQSMCGWMVKGTPFTLTAATLIETFCVPALLHQHPQLDEVEVPEEADQFSSDDWDNWIATQVEKFGAELTVSRKEN